MPNEIIFRSTSLNSNVGSPITLRQNQSWRLVFIPELVNNPQDQSASVRGKFICQRKGNNEQWENYPPIPLNALRAGDGVQLELHSGEIKTLLEELNNCYGLYEEYGIQIGKSKFQKVENSVAYLSDNLQNSEMSYEQFYSVGGEKVLIELLEWLINSGDESSTREIVSIISNLKNLPKENLHSISKLAGLKEVVDIWTNNNTNTDEEFWHQLLKQHVWVLEHIFPSPVTLIKDKAYVGGKSVNNDGGKIVDFLLKNELTENVNIIEIKTPESKILGGVYRSTYSINAEFSGGINQVLGYRQSIMTDYSSIIVNSDYFYKVFNPQCVFIIGNKEKELIIKDQIVAFELFRSELKNITIITFDELFGRISNLIKLLESN